jgi:structural hemagglutinin/hemolysin toxin protein RtxA
MYKLVVFVPATHLEKVKNALFARGAGRSANYSHCCWQTLGQMQYLPLPSSDPAVGKPGEMVATQEYKVEMVCEEQYLSSVIAELKKVHPYEEPAYEIYKLEQRY